MLSKQSSEQPDLDNDRGFISIFSVIIIMAVLTLVAVGFSNVTRRAQRRTLDNQLNTQAFYAAESGINDARAVLATNNSLVKTECQGPTAGFNYTLDAAVDVGYSCVLINTRTSDLIFNSIPMEGSGNAKVTAFESSNNAVINSFDITWDATGSAAGTAAISSDPTLVFPNLFTPSTSWGSKLGVVRVDLVPSNGSFARDVLATGTYTFFLYPLNTAAGSSHTILSGTANQGVLLPVKCAAAVSPCSATITLGGATNSSKYFMRLQALYSSVQVTVKNVKDAASTALTLQNGQAVIDVTGRSSDVYRRVQVRLPVLTNGVTASFTLQTADSICKRLLGAPAPTGSTNSATGDTAADTGVCVLNN